MLTVGNDDVALRPEVVESTVWWRHWWGVVVVELETLGKLHPAVHGALSQTGCLYCLWWWINGTYLLSLTAAVPVVDKEELHLLLKLRAADMKHHWDDADDDDDDRWLHGHVSNVFSFSCWDTTQQLGNTGCHSPRRALLSSAEAVAMATTATAYKRLFGFRWLISLYIFVVFRVSTCYYRCLLFLTFSFFNFLRSCNSVRMSHCIRRLLDLTWLVSEILLLLLVLRVMMFTV